MIREVEGDILLSKAKVIVHGVAPNDDFKKGLASSIKENWPALYKDFRHYCHTSHPKEGTLWSWASSDGQQFVQLFTQEHPKSAGQIPGKATAANVNHCLRELRKFVEEEGVDSLALPRVATGVGGLEWEEVKELVTKHLGDLDATIDLYTKYVKGQEV